MKSTKKCIVKGCLNRSNQGKFVGELCGPCHAFITTWEGRYSQVYRNSLKVGMEVAMRHATDAIREAFEDGDPTVRRGVIADEELANLVRAG